MEKKSSNQTYLKDGFAKIERDLRFLMDCLSEVLEDAGESLLARCLPWVGNPKIASEKIPVERLCQAYSIAFQLLNIVEENTAAQVRRQREAELGVVAEHGLWGYHFRNLKTAGISPEKIVAMLSQIVVEPVLTAHPTEAKRSIILQHHRQLYLLLVQRENQMWTPLEQKAIRDEIKVELERLWRTGEIYLHKPEVSAERQSILYYLHEVFPLVLSKLDLRLRQAWSEMGFSTDFISGPQALPSIKFGTWVGGDRDGHPFVTEKTTEETLRELRSNALLLLQRVLRVLPQKLSLSSHWQSAPKALLATINKRIQRSDPAVQQQILKLAEEPWRQFAQLLVEALPVKISAEGHISLAFQAGTYQAASELEQDLLFLRQSLIEAHATRIATADIDPIIRHLRVFGFHLASLDIRQNSKFHDIAFDQLLRKAGIVSGNELNFAEWSEEKRLELLNRELLSPSPLLSADVSAGTEADAILRCYRVLACHLRDYGSDGLGALIVSMTRQLSDLLIVYLLAREAGVTFWSGNRLTCPLSVVPLFERVEDLARSSSILTGFLAHPVTQASFPLQSRGTKKPIVQVMIGYSDSNKDAGILASQWELYRAQKSMMVAARRFGVVLRFFHGRGGTISRGAGPTHRFLEALPRGSLTGGIRVTEQGETIAQKYANRSTATYNLELLLASTAGEILLRGKSQPKEENIDCILDFLATESSSTYRALLNAEKFMEFYNQATPIDALECSSMGSRPLRRNGARTFSDLRAIPWVFSWNQSRFYLPGWFGVGAALEKLQRQDPLAFRKVKNSALVHPLLRYTLTNVETNLASAHLRIMEDYAALVRNVTIRRRFMTLISAEFKRSYQMVETVLGGALSERRPRMLKTLVLREEALALLHNKQLYLLKTWRAYRAERKNAQANKILPELLLSINAIAGGLRTTG